MKPCPNNPGAQIYITLGYPYPLQFGIIYYNCLNTRTFFLIIGETDTAPDHKRVASTSFNYSPYYFY